MSLENPSREYEELSQDKCARCQGKFYSYRDGRWTEWICWKCGNYEADTPAFMQSPLLFHDVVRKNAKYFMSKYAYYARGHVSGTE